MITNGIKPTRLWHLTGKKHFQNWLNDRLTAVKNSNYSQRERKDLLQLFGLVTALAAGVAYSYGMFTTPRNATTVIRPPGTGDAKPKKTCPTTGIPQPCPASKPQNDKRK